MRNNIMQESANSRHGFTCAHFQRTQLRALIDWKKVWYRQNKKFLFRFCDATLHCHRDSKTAVAVSKT
jgi:hypothetical protein